MPKWRKLHVKTTESHDINDMPDDFHRLLWVMLPLGLDSEGRGLDNPSWIRSKAMPLRNDVTIEMIERAMAWYAERGMVERYALNGRFYFWVPSFRRYQGNTSKEAESEYPPPNSDPSCDQGAPSSGPTPDLLPTESGLDVDVDVDSDSRDGANAPSKKRKPTGRNALYAELESYFVNITRLPLPDWSTARGRKEAGVRWKKPLLAIAEICEDDFERTKALIKWAVTELDKSNKYSVSAPESIRKIAIGEQGRRLRGVNGGSRQDTREGGVELYGELAPTS